MTPPPHDPVQSDVKSRRAAGTRGSDSGPASRGGAPETSVAEPPASLDSPLLAASAAAVIGRWQYAEHAAASAADVRDAVEIVCETIRAAIAGEDPLAPALPPFVSGRRVLEMLRRAYLEFADAVDADHDPRQVVQAVAAMERVQRILDEDAAHRFASRLSGGDAQQLVVEMAHDMRSPLGSILILAERLRHSGGGNFTQIQERQLGLIYSAAFGLSSLASDVIELARGGTTLIDQPAMPFSVSDVLQSILDILRPMAEEKNIIMRCTPPEADVRVGFQAALNRVLLNLTTNALKFTNAGSVDVICRQLDRTRIEFSVKDTGRGIPPHVLSNLFEAFRQRQLPGGFAFSSAGLGLSICKKLVVAMGGELGVETELEKGTRFHFVVDLPLPARL
jgi:signal transduction histidine kinase